MKYLIILVFLYANTTYGQFALGLNLEKGNTYFLNMNSTFSINTEMNGQKVTIASSMKGLAKFKVIKASDQEYELEASFDSLHMTIKSPMGLMEFSSGNASQQEDMTSGALNSMMNKHFNVTLLKNGAVKNIQNPDTAGFAKILKNFPAFDQLKKMLLMGHMNHSFNAKALKEKMEMLTAIFPNKKVALNEEWGSTIKPDSATDDFIKTSYKLVDNSSGIATIKGHNTLKASNSKKQGKRLPAIYDLVGSAESTIKVDVATGWIREADIHNELNGTLQMKEGTMMNNGNNKSVPIRVQVEEKLSSR